MRFVKLRNERGGRDLLHVWIEEDCPPKTVSAIISLLKDEALANRFVVVDRRYYQVSPNETLHSG